MEKIFHLREEILKEHSRSQCNNIDDWISDDQKRFDALFRLFLDGEYRVTQRAAWPLSYCVAAHPAFIKKNFSALVKNLAKPDIHDSVKRNTLRILQRLDIPKRYEGELMDLCFRYVESATEPVAVKAFSLTVLGKLAIRHPDILPEIKLLIEEQLPHQTAAFKSRAKQLLKQAGKL